MKKVIYDFNHGEGNVYLTEREFITAMNLWNTGKDYYCSRLETLMPKPKLAVPEDESFYLLPESIEDGHIRKFLRNTHGELCEEEGCSLSLPVTDPAVLEQLITDDEFAEKFHRVTHTNKLLNNVGQDAGNL